MAEQFASPDVVELTRANFQAACASDTDAGLTAARRLAASPG
jgi:hypothetical protein